MKFLLKQSILFLLITVSTHTLSLGQTTSKNKTFIAQVAVEEKDPSLIAVNVWGKSGNSPNWDGLSSIINDVNFEVQKILRGNQPYKVVPYPFKNTLKSGFSAGIRTYTNEFQIEIYLQECEEKDRDWHFDFYATISPKISTSISKDDTYKNAQKRFKLLSNNSKIRKIGSDIFDISNLDYPTTKNHSLAINIVAGQKYGNDGIFDNETVLNNPIELPSSNLNEKLYLNQGSSNSIEINKSNSAKAGNSTLSDDPSIAINQLIKLKSLINSSKKMTSTEKQEALVKLNDAIKQYRDIIELNKIGQKWDEFMTFNDGRKENGKITNSRLLEYLNEADKKLLLRILNREIDLDPQSKHGSSCGTIVTNCRQCGDRISVTSRYRSIGYTIRDLNDLPVFYILNESEVKELKSYFQKIRSGNNYICDAYNDEKFCSKQHKYLFQQR